VTSTAGVNHFGAPDVTLSQTASDNRNRDLQVEGSRIVMSEAQLERAALRLTMKTRPCDRDALNAGASSLDTDASLVAQAFLDLKREMSDGHTLFHLAASQGLKERLERDGIKLKMHPSIQLASGVYYDFTDPCSTPLSIEDIAAGLSRVCRYTGQLGTHVDDNAVYTVAQHSVLASENCAPGHELAALMHDATESVINDMASPLKQLLPCYKAVEDRCERSIFQTFGLPLELSPEVKLIDLIMLATEKRDLMPRIENDNKWTMLEGIDPLPFTIRPWTPAEARARFLARFAFLTEGALPKPGDPFATPHENAPAVYVDQWRRASSPKTTGAVNCWVPQGLRTDREDGWDRVEITTAPPIKPTVAGLASALIAAVADAGVNLADVVQSAVVQAQIDFSS
jgi:hypothetical protein